MMNDLEKREDLVRRAIAKYRNEPDFPQFEDYGGDEDLLDEYFYLQTPQGSMEEEKRKLTIYGVLIIVPIAVVSFFFRDITGLLMGVLIGGVLSGLYYLFLKSKANKLWRRFEKANIEKYIEDVLSYRKKEEKENPK